MIRLTKSEMYTLYILQRENRPMLQQSITEKMVGRNHTSSSVLKALYNSDLVLCNSPRFVQSTIYEITTKGKEELANNFERNRNRLQSFSISDLESIHYDILSVYKASSTGAIQVEIIDGLHWARISFASSTN